MLTQDFDFCLPKRLIAQAPLEKREDSKMLVVNKKTGQITHARFADFLQYTQSGDCVVFNDSKVVCGRLRGKTGKNANVEITLIRRIKNNVWQALVKPGKKMRMGETAIFADDALRCNVTSVLEGGLRLLNFESDGNFFELLRKYGKAPLPPYIRESLRDANRYQTVYAKKIGSAAAPTAGLHFTDEYLLKMKNAGVITSFITLHVGLGTFLPVKTETVMEHKLHSEDFFISDTSASEINGAKQAGKKIIAVGTTSVRALESAAKSDGGFVGCGAGNTDIFIYPGYAFKVPDTLLTNFHLPRSTLLMLVCAFAGYELTLEAYKKAVENNYRFFSFGDCMLVHE